MFMKRVVVNIIFFFLITIKVFFSVIILFTRILYINPTFNDTTDYSKREVDQLVPLLLRDRVMVQALLDEFEERSQEDIQRAALLSGFATFCSFVFFGLIPLVSTITLQIYTPFVSSCIWTACTLVGLGWFKVRFFLVHYYFVLL